MITGITLQNFKGFREPGYVPLKPITLMFGANSSGKSTILQAIHYAREILQHGNVNPDSTSVGGASIDLGGFANLVHNHELDRHITLRFDLNLTNWQVPMNWYVSKFHYTEDPPDLSDKVRSAWVEITTMWSSSKEHPIERDQDNPIADVLNDLFRYLYYGHFASEGSDLDREFPFRGTIPEGRTSGAAAHLSQRTDTIGSALYLLMTTRSTTETKLLLGAIVLAMARHPKFGGTNHRPVVPVIDERKSSRL